jgi:enoyl-[acyl-carrier-protein] reductase (NADH)
MREGKLILLHGFSNEEAVAVMRAVKAVVPEPAEIAFAVTTPTNLEWKINDLVDQVRFEHEYLKKNPPDPQKGINDE